jgi:hypothetical protein
VTENKLNNNFSPIRIVTMLYAILSEWKNQFELCEDKLLYGVEESNMELKLAVANLRNKRQQFELAFKAAMLSMDRMADTMISWQASCIGAEDEYSAVIIEYGDIGFPHWTLEQLINNLTKHRNIIEAGVQPNIAEAAPFGPDLEETGPEMGEAMGHDAAALEVDHNTGPSQQAALYKDAVVDPNAAVSRDGDAAHVTEDMASSSSSAKRARTDTAAPEVGHNSAAVLHTSASQQAALNADAVNANAVLSPDASAAHATEEQDMASSSPSAKRGRMDNADAP